MLCCLFGHKESNLSNIEVINFFRTYIDYSARCSRCGVVLVKSKIITDKLSEVVILKQLGEIEYLNAKIEQLNANE